MTPRTRWTCSRRDTRQRAGARAVNTHIVRARVVFRRPAMIYAWHFVPANMKLAHSDEPVEVGRTYRVKGKIVPCKNGLHGSIRLLDALGYTSSSILTRCSYAGEVVHESNKLAASERTILWLGDIGPILHEAACAFAEGALRIAKVTNLRSWAAI